ncbi:MAG: helix-turn-helix domain-containing protein [Chloroflexi bacterium]|nr:helix-turn-helix domain-containing protein [Chloroflexota bacterium]
MVHHGYRFDEIVRTVNVRNRSLIYYWMKRWKQDGIASLFHQAPRSGRPLITDAAYREILEATLSRQPEEYGYGSPGWTVEMLQQVMQERTGRRLSENTFRALLHRLGYSFQREPVQYRPPIRRPKLLEEIGAWREYIMSLPPRSLPVYTWRKKNTPGKGK